MKMKNFEDKMGVFKLSMHQDVITYLYTLKKKNLKIADVKAYVDTKKKQLLLLDGHHRTPCPVCSGPLISGLVNTSPGNQVGGEFTSQLFCPRCGYDKYFTS